MATATTKTDGTPATELSLSKRITNELKEATTTGKITKDELKQIAKIANSLVVLVA
jgi:hypothetical protein